MADDPKKRGLDGKLVSQQRHEVAYVAKKAKVTPAVAKKAIQDAGPSRKAVEAKIAKKPSAKPVAKAVAKKPTPKR